METVNMSEDLVAKAMLAMGWNSDSDMPMADMENRSILKELQELVEERSLLLEAQQQTAQRVEKLAQHSKNAEASINHNLKLLHAYQSDLRTEAHLYKLAQREHSKLKQDLKDIDKENDKLTQYVQSSEKELCKRKRRVEDMTNRIKGAKTALIEWQQAMEDSNKGSQLIERYFKEDELRAREVDVRRNMLQNEIEKGRKQLIELHDEQRALEQNLECVANMYRATHAERRDMIDTWKASVSQMLRCERDIEQGEMELIDLKREAKKKLDEQKRQDKKLTELVESNRETEAAIEDLNNGSSDIKDQIQKLRDMIILKENEMETLQKELQNLSNRVEQQRMENRNNEKKKNAKLNELQNFEVVMQKVQDRLKSMENKNMSAQQRLKILEDMTDVEEKAMAEINQETARINGLIYRAQTQATKLKDDEKVLQMEREGIRVGMQAVKRNAQKMEKVLTQRTELHYSMGFKCLNLERRILKLEGGVIDPEVEHKNLEYLAELEEKQVDTNKRLRATEAENKKLDYNMRKVTICYNADADKLKDIHFKIKEAQAYCEGGFARLKKERQQNQVLIVELSLLKMRADEFEKQIAECNSVTYNLDKHRMSLNRTFKDRMVEIKSQMDLLQQKRKHLNEEKSTLSADIGERNKHIDAVRARFELTSQLLGTNEDGSLVTATQLKVEAAQEKQALLEEGDQLNAKVLKAEKEIKAMENTLLLLNNSNDAYRRNYQRVVDGDEAHTELKSLQESYCKALNKLKTLRSKILNIEQSNEVARRQKEQMEKTLELETRKRQENEEQLAKLQKELDEQKVKIQRAERDVKVAVKALKQQHFSPEYLAQFERELDLRELEYRYTKALNKLCDMADNDDEIGPKVFNILLEKGLKLPPQLRRSHSFASWRSDLSDVSKCSSRDLPNTTSRSSASEATQQTHKSVVSVVSIEFAP